MKVEIWSDVVCPWCYIGKRRFEAALAPFDGRDDGRGPRGAASSSTPTHPRRRADDPRRVPGARSSARPPTRSRARTSGSSRWPRPRGSTTTSSDVRRVSTRSTPTASPTWQGARARAADPGAAPARASSSRARCSTTRTRSSGSRPRSGSRAGRGATCSPGTPTPPRSRPTSRGPRARRQRRAVLRHRPALRDLRRPARRAVPRGAAAARRDAEAEATPARD